MKLTVVWTVVVFFRNTNCLSNTATIFNETLYQESLNIAPGLKYTRDQQCQAMEGEAGAYAVANLANICAALVCYTPSVGQILINDNLAFDFTSCGSKKVNKAIFVSICISFCSNGFESVFNSLAMLVAVVQGSPMCLRWLSSTGYPGWAMPNDNFGKRCDLWRGTYKFLARSGAHFAVVWTGMK